MTFVRLTLFNGSARYVNLNQVVSIEALISPNSNGSRLYTTITDMNGKPEVLAVQETPEVILERVRRPGL